MKRREDACPGCGKPVDCGVAAGESSCWCMELPIGLPLPDGEARCYCRGCLDRLSAACAPAAREA